MAHPSTASRPPSPSAHQNQSEVEWAWRTSRARHLESDTRRFGNPPIRVTLTELRDKPGRVGPLFDLIRELKRKQVGIVYVSRRLNEITGLVDRVTVLRDGRSMGTLPAADIDRGKIVSLVTGHDALPLASCRSAKPDETPLLVAKQLSRDGEFEDVFIDVRRGEVVVVTGLVGSGRTELLETSLSSKVPGQGRDLLGRPQMRVGFHSSRDPGWNCFDPGRPPGARTLHDPANVRKRCDGDFATLLQRARSLARLEIEHADAMIRALNIRPADANVEAGTLSDGNQQKVVLAKWLSTDANVFLFDEPTQGVDVGAKSEIHDIVRNLAARGKAVLIASSDLEEVLAVADRILAMRRGRIVAEFSAAAVKASDLVETITHGSIS